MIGSYEMAQVTEFGFKVCGASADDIVDCHHLALEAWGERVKEKNSGLLAMAYLWRRFGPPWLGGDDYKSLVEYTLTTGDEQVFLWLHLSGSGMEFSVGYLAHESIREEVYRPRGEWYERYEDWWWAQHPELDSLEETNENREKISELYWNERTDGALMTKAKEALGDLPQRTLSKNWKDGKGVINRVNTALFEAMKELERPVYVRDCAFNIFGRCDDTDEPAETSPYAGYGVPKEAMDLSLQEE